MEPTNMRRVHNPINNTMRRVHNPINNTKLEDLPLHLIHHIMHFLPYKDAIKFSVLSKAFYSYWLSFPVLHFSCIISQGEPDSYHTFFSFIQKILQLRGPYIKGCLQKLSLFYVEVGTFNPYPYRTVFDLLLNFAMVNNCEEIQFDIGMIAQSRRFLDGMNDIVNVSHDSLFPLFSSQFLTVLKLMGIKIPIADTLITCPNLEELLIHYCQGFQTISVLSSSLKEVEVKGCKGLKAFQLEGKSLHSFKFEGIRTNHELHPCDINLLACDHLRSLHLTNVKVPENIVKVVTEFWHIDHCDMPKNLRYHNPHIKVLEMKSNYNLENLVLSTPNLECFMYDSSEIQLQCTVDISKCLALTILELIKEESITDEWLRSTVSSLGCLEELKISHCNRLEKMEFKNDNLEKFSLCGCSKLKEVNIDARNLLEFNYDGSLQVYPFLILSTKCNGNIILPHDIRLNQILWFEIVTQFLHSFDHFKELTLSCFNAKGLIFPEVYVCPNKLSPLYDLKHVKLQASMPLSDQTVTQLVESLLWLVPKPLTLTLSCLDLATTSTLKFEYGKKVKTTKVEACCYNMPIKCWRHFELKIEFQGFDESARECLEKFFAPYLC